MNKAKPTTKGSDQKKIETVTNKVWKFSASYSSSAFTLLIKSSIPTGF